MPRRNVLLISNEIYHVFNRSIAKTDIFFSKINLRRILETIDYYRYRHIIRLSKFKSLPQKIKEEYMLRFKNTEPLIEIYAYSIMPNHYHFLLKQIQNGGIAKFISTTQNSFAKYFNLKNNRDGSLFQNAFKAKRVNSEEELIHISRYIHLNPITACLIEIEELTGSTFTSFPYYIHEEKHSVINTQLLLGIFQDAHAYKKFVFDQSDYQKKLGMIKNLIGKFEYE